MSSLDSKFFKLLVYLAVTLLFGFIFSVLSFALLSAISGNSFGEVSTMLNNLDIEKNITLTKVFLFLNSFGLFVLPPIIYCYILKQPILSFFKLNELKTIQLLPVLFLLFVLLLPILNFTVEWNKLLELPKWLQGLEHWMRTAEDSAAIKTQALLKLNSYNDLIINVLLIGVLPAVGEELAFRGVLQQTLIGKNSNPHWGIWGAAFIFSFIHFQFFGFLPRLLLGAFFGYLFYWSKSLWLPILGHLINNTSAVLIAFYLKENRIEEKLERVGTTQETNYFLIVSLVLFSGLLYYFKKQCDRILS